jgi:hypothetical protein
LNLGDLSVPLDEKKAFEGKRNKKIYFFCQEIIHYAQKIAGILSLD